MPQSAAGCTSLGLALAQLGTVDEAVVAFRAAVRLQPDSALAHHNLGVAQAQQGKLADAVADFGEALRLKPEYAEAHYNLVNGKRVAEVMLTPIGDHVSGDRTLGTGHSFQVTDGLTAGPNPYDYVRNNPTNATDPSGLELVARSRSTAEEVQGWLAGKTGDLGAALGYFNPSVQTTVNALPGGRYVITPTNYAKANAAVKEQELENPGSDGLDLLKALVSTSNHVEVYWKKVNANDAHQYEGSNGFFNFVVKGTILTPTEMGGINAVEGRSWYGMDKVFPGEDLNLNHVTNEQAEKLIDSGQAEGVGWGIVVKVAGADMRIVLAPVSVNSKTGEERATSLLHPETSYYKAVAIVSGLTARHVSSEALADRYVNDARILGTLTLLEQGMTGVLHALPFGTMADHLQNGYGTWEDAVIGSVGDLGSALTFGSSKLSVQIAGMAIQGGVIGFGGYQLNQALESGDRTRAGALTGEIVFRLATLGLGGLKVFATMRKVKVTPVVNGTSAAEKAVDLTAKHGRLNKAATEAAVKDLVDLGKYEISFTTNLRPRTVQGQGPAVGSVPLDVSPSWTSFTIPRLPNGKIPIRLDMRLLKNRDSLRQVIRHEVAETEYLLKEEGKLMDRESLRQILDLAHNAGLAAE